MISHPKIPDLNRTFPDKMLLKVVLHHLAQRGYCRQNRIKPAAIAIISSDIPVTIPYFRGYETSFTALTIMHSPTKICFYYTGKDIIRH